MSTNITVTIAFLIEYSTLFTISVEFFAPLEALGAEARYAAAAAVAGVIATLERADDGDKRRDGETAEQQQQQLRRDGDDAAKL